MSETQASPSPQPYQQFRELAEGLFTVSKSELDARLAEEKATRQAERERRRREKAEKQK